MKYLGRQFRDMLPGDVIVQTARHGRNVTVLRQEGGRGLVFREDGSVAMFEAPGVYRIMRPEHRVPGPASWKSASRSDSTEWCTGRRCAGGEHRHHYRRH